MLADDMQRDEARGQRLPTDEEVTDMAGAVLASAMSKHEADGKDAAFNVIKELMSELISMTRALRDAQEEIRDTDERIGKVLSFLTNASNVLTRKD